MKTDLVLDIGQDFKRLSQILAGKREGDVGGLAVGRDVLHDHVDADIGLGQGPEDGCRYARLVLDPPDRNFRLVFRIGDAAHHMLLHDIVLTAYDGSGPRSVGFILVGRIGRFEA